MQQNILKRCMIYDQNTKVYARVAELGVSAVPHVFFDGGYRDMLGAQTDEQPYQNAITQSGEILIIKGGSSLEMININKFEQILKDSSFKQNNSPEFLITDREKAQTELINPFGAYVDSE